jgi:hypothetical protein
MAVSACRGMYDGDGDRGYADRRDHHPRQPRPARARAELNLVAGNWPALFRTRVTSIFHSHIIGRKASAGIAAGAVQPNC